ncbi:MAG: hypothetical protein OEU26_07160, partial [Candidatus Tectomicrobia bacterium]|nr:hypothetical protein [Candidatus Tectomicrobia bacterium]
LSLTDFSEIRNTTTSDSAPGKITGMVRIIADTVSLTNGSEIDSNTSGAGDAGSITLNVGQLVADGDSKITSTSARGATGNAGTVTIQGPSGPGTMARLITLSNAVVETQANGAEGGNIVVAASTVELTEGARITAESSGEGNAGNITITAADTFLSEDSSVTTEARQAQGGEIRITAQSMVRLRNTQVTTEVEAGAERAGNIIIDPDFVIVENSQIVTQAEGGPGGDIRITAAAAVLINPDSVVDASSAQNIDGEIDIRAPVTNLSSSISQLPQRFLSAQLRSQCAERWRGGEVSHLVESGRDGLPAQPGSLLPSSLIKTVQRQAEGVASHGTQMALSADFSRTRSALACAKWETR